MLNRAENIDNEIKEQMKELNNPSRTVPRGIILGEIERLKFKKGLTEKKSDELHTDRETLEKELQALCKHDSSSLFCGTASAWHKRDKTNKITAINDEISLRNSVQEVHQCKKPS